MSKPAAPPPDPAAWVRSNCVDMNERLSVRYAAVPHGTATQEYGGAPITQGARTQPSLRPPPTASVLQMGSAGRRSRLDGKVTPCPRFRFDFAQEPCIAREAALGASPAQQGRSGRSAAW
ncbi:hypothetical protein LH19_12830 [Sphingopyxis macrogoltabida]|nr:hypothetical protein LH19_12830 [Sphingopyxis macrogoltabida]